MFDNVLYILLFAQNGQFPMKNVIIARELFIIVHLSYVKKRVYIYVLIIRNNVYYVILSA